MNPSQIENLHQKKEDKISEKKKIFFKKENFSDFQTNHSRSASLPKVICLSSSSVRLV